MTIELTDGEVRYILAAIEHLMFYEKDTDGYVSQANVLIDDLIKKLGGKTDSE